MNQFNISDENKKTIDGMIHSELESAIGRKVLEFGSGRVSLAEELADDLEYIACTDKSAEALEQFRLALQKESIHIIPDNEMGEDCYFGRFHMIYTVFGFHGLAHLVDEIMRLRRLILKGGKLVIIEETDGDFEAECLKQLKRCGFLIKRTEPINAVPNPLFLISAEK